MVFSSSQRNLMITKILFFLDERPSRIYIPQDVLSMRFHCLVLVIGIFIRCMGSCELYIYAAYYPTFFLARCNRVAGRGREGAIKGYEVCPQVW
jgi:hypothetical protein